MDTEHVAGSIWKVQSESGTKWYVVDLDVPNCTCTDWATKRNKLVHVGKPDFYECKHVLQAKVSANFDQREIAAKEAVEARAEEIKSKFRK